MDTHSKLLDLGGVSTGSERRNDHFGYIKDESQPAEGEIDSEGGTDAAQSEKTKPLWHRHLLSLSVYG